MDAFDGSLAIPENLKMPDDKPILIAALLCQNVLQEKDGTLSVIRIMDRATIEIPPDFPEDAKPLVHISGLIALKSGSFVGDGLLEIFIESPDGRRRKAYDFRFQLPGGHHGMNINMDIKLGLESEGFYWFDVLINQESRSRIPLEIVFQRLPRPKDPGQDEEQPEE